MQLYQTVHLQLTVQQHVRYTEPNCAMLSGMAAHVQLTVQQPEHAPCADGICWAPAHVSGTLLAPKQFLLLQMTRILTSLWAGHGHAMTAACHWLAWTSRPQMSTALEPLSRCKHCLPAALPHRIKLLACAHQRVSCGSCRAGTWPPAHPLITAAQRSPMDFWTPTSGASISAAVAGDGLLIACCSDFKVMCLYNTATSEHGSWRCPPWRACDAQGASKALICTACLKVPICNCAHLAFQGLMALTAAELGTQSPPGSGHLAGKRKRQQRHWQLHLAGQQSLQAEASCLHLVGNNSAEIAGKVLHGEHLACLHELKGVGEGIQSLLDLLDCFWWSLLLCCGDQCMLPAVTTSLLMATSADVQTFLLPAADQSPSSAMLAVGTYQPAVQLLQVQTDPTHQEVTFVLLASFCLSSLPQHSAAHISSFPPSDQQPVSPARPSHSSQTQQTPQKAPEAPTSPWKGSSPPAAAAGSLTAAALGDVPAEQDVPESVQLLPRPPGHAECPHLLVGLRSGTLIQLQADHAHTGTLQSLARLSLDQEQQDLMEDGSGSPMSQPMNLKGADDSCCVFQHAQQPGPEPPLGGRDQPMRLCCMLRRRLGLTPVTLVPLPAAEGLRSPSLALSDGLSLLGQHAGSGRVLCRLLAVRGVQHVAPLWQPASTMQSSANSRWVGRRAPSCFPVKPQLVYSSSSTCILMCSRTSTRC